MVLRWGRASLDPEHCCSPVRRAARVCQQGPEGYLGVIVPLGYKTVLAVALCQRGGGSCGGRTSFCWRFLCYAALGDLRSAVTASSEALSLRPNQPLMVQSWGLQPRTLCHLCPLLGWVAFASNISRWCCLLECPLTTAGLSSLPIFRVVVVLYFFRMFALNLGKCSAEICIICFNLARSGSNSSVDVFVT